ncbi:MAG: HEAT repeat domain-containing protein [Planctomycetota bacterium]
MRQETNKLQPEQLQALIKSLNIVLPAKVIWEKSKQALALAAQAPRELEAFSRLLIPPGCLRTVPHADTTIRTRVVQVLGLTHDRRTLEALINSAVYDTENTVRAAAAAALVLLEEPVALRKLCDLAIASDNQKFPWTVRKRACQAIRHYGDNEAIERLLHALSYELAGGNPRDPRNKPRGVIQGLGTENALMLPDEPLAGAPEQDLYPVLSALKEVTGKKFNTDEKDIKTWQHWWDKESEKFVFNKGLLLPGQ